MTVEKERPASPSKTSTSASTAMAGMATSMIQQFKPLKGICKHLSGIHGYAAEPSRQVISNHFCSPLGEDVHQCVIYDAYDTTDARLIGVEYIISRTRFEALPDEEKVYWHSHVNEVKGGGLVMPRVPEVMERSEMSKLVDTYGKTWHFWQTDRGDSLPFGEPQLMCAITDNSMLDVNLLTKRDAQLGIHTEKIIKSRRDIDTPIPHPLADSHSKYVNKQATSH